MCIALIGGMDRLKKKYISEAERMGIYLKVYTRSEKGIASKVTNVDAVIIFTNKVSHRAKIEVMSIAKAKNIPVFMYHSCGLCTLRNCLSCLKNLSIKTGINSLK